MDNLKIPPHLQIAESVTEEEYRRSMVQSKIVLVIALSVGFISGVFFVFFVTGILIGIGAAGALAVTTERLLHLIFKDAHKAYTHRIKKYKELRAFKKRHNMQ